MSNLLFAYLRDNPEQNGVSLKTLVTYFSILFQMVPSILLRATQGKNKQYMLRPCHMCMQTVKDPRSFFVVRKLEIMKVRSDVLFLSACSVAVC